MSLAFLLNHFLIKKNILISETGDIHQKFASKSKVPLTGGILFFLSILFFFQPWCFIFYFIFFYNFSFGDFFRSKIYKIC